MNSKLISIIIPLYNVERYVDSCLQSVVQQIDERVEVIIVNDGSTDQSPDICQKYENRYQSIRVVNQANAGLSAARNTGIKNAHGDYILFLDSDDYLAPEAIKQVIEATTKNTDIIVGKALTVDEQTNSINNNHVNYIENYNNQPDKWLFEMDKKSDFWFAAWLIIIKRDFLENNNLYFLEGIYHEDELWVPTVFSRARTMMVLNYDFYCYRINRQGSIVNSVNTKKEFDKIVIIDEFNKIKFESEISRSLIDARCAALLYGIIRKLSLIDNENEREQLISMVSSRLSYLKHSKYWGVYFICKLLGVRRSMAILSAK